MNNDLVKGQPDAAMFSVVGGKYTKLALKNQYRLQQIRLLEFGWTFLPDITYDVFTAINADDISGDERCIGMRE